jgi:hypothetical protein
MILEKFDDHCPGCKPVILNPETSGPFPENHPAMVKFRRIWNKTTREQREAFHNVMCVGSRDRYELRLVKQITDQLWALYEKIPLIVQL